MGRVQELVIPEETALVAVDPGRNIGLALLDAHGGLLAAAVVTAAQLARIDLPLNVPLVVGGGTGSKSLLTQLGQAGKSPEVADEKGTTLEGRALYWLLNPARGVWRLLPPGLRPVPAGIDAWAAYAIGRRWLGADAGPAVDRRQA